MAPQANLVGVKVLDAGGSGSFATVMAGMQWTVDHRYEFNIRAASMSLGGPGAIEWTSSEEDSVNRYANEMVRAGVAMFIAAGNNGVAHKSELQVLLKMLSLLALLTRILALRFILPKDLLRKVESNQTLHLLVQM